MHASLRSLTETRLQFGCQAWGLSQLLGSWNEAKRALLLIEDVTNVGNKPFCLLVEVTAYRESHTC